MSSTFASVFIAAADQAAAQAAAQADLGEGFFTAPLSPTGEPPVTHFWSTGWWFDEELDRIVNDVSWPRTVKFGDAQAALDSMGLKPVVEPVVEPVEQPE